MRQSVQSIVTIALPAIAFVACPVVATEAGELLYKDRLIPVLVKHVEGLLDEFDADTGRFGQGVWICTDQNRMYPLAVAYATRHDGNPYYKDTRLLDAIVKAGDALIADADEKGQWVFRKKDGSTWGKIWMPWTYSRWIRSFALIRDDMPADRREAWTKALTLGFGGISKSQLGHVHNIPAHHAMGLYIAGETLGHPDWSRQAGEFLIKVVNKQADGGYWSENYGPVVGYNFVYLDALGTYYALTRDQRVLAALEKGAVFHYHFRYPNGERVETVDERNPYEHQVDAGNVGFTMMPTGRLYVAEQWSHIGWDKLSADLIASLLLYGQEGSTAPSPAGESARTFVLAENERNLAATVRSGPWFACLSAYTTPSLANRWIQDRQNLVSIYHDKRGVILGGGNTKLQPAWSNFTVGDMAFLQHKQGDTNPDFKPKGELYHVPTAAELITQPDPGLDLTYGPAACRIRFKPKGDTTCEYVIEATTDSTLPILAHLTLIPHMGETIETAIGQKTKLGESAINWSAEQVAGRLTHAGCRLHLPKSASVHWPALPHNPYRKDGHATPSEGRIEIRIPFDTDNTKHTIIMEILE